MTPASASSGCSLFKINCQTQNYSAYLFLTWATVVAQWQRTHLVLGSIPSLSILQYWVLNQVPQGGETLLIFQFPHKNGFLAVQLGANKHRLGKKHIFPSPLFLLASVCMQVT